MPQTNAGITHADTEFTFPFPRPSACPYLPPSEVAKIREAADGKLTMVDFETGDTAAYATGFDDVKALLLHPALSNDVTREDFPAMSEAAKANRGTNFNFLKSDPPKHDVQRQMLMADFTVRKIEELRPVLDAFVDTLLDAMEDTGHADLVTDFAEPVPGLIVVRLLDLPEGDREWLQESITKHFSLDLPPAEIVAANQVVLEYMDRLIDDRSGSGKDDLVSRLVREQLEPGHISRTDLIYMLDLLAIAGFDTTANMIALGTLALLDHPDQLALLVSDPSITANAVEELLRYISVAHVTSFRVATEDLEINGQHVPEHTGIIASLQAANWDPRKFPEPERLDFRRKGARANLAFGAGVHSCLGQALARMELQVVFPKLFRRFPNLRLAVPAEQIAYKNAIIYGVKSLPVEWR